MKKYCLIVLCVLMLTILTALPNRAQAETSQADLLVQFMMNQVGQPTKDENGNTLTNACAKVIAAGARYAGMTSS